MSLPSFKEIAPHNSLDEQAACKHFLGKSVDEAVELFRENSLYYQEDLMWMGPVAFRYYVEAAIRYIESEAATDDSDMISCFTSILEFRLEHESAELWPISERLAAICAFILDHYERYNVTEVNDDIRARVRRLHQAFGT